MTAAALALIALILLALLFDYTNGFHDAANSIAGVVTTGVLTPRQAILLGAAGNLSGALSGTAVAHTIGNSILKPELVTLELLLIAVATAIFWNFLTWSIGMPSSSSHALVAGLVGAAAAHLGWSDLNYLGIVKILLALVVSPMIGFCGGILMMILLLRLVHRCPPRAVTIWFGRGQILTALASAYSHGCNDAQKSMGIITLGLVGAGYLTTFQVPHWVMLACAIAMGLGVLSGGWKIIKTLGQGVFDLEPINSVAIDTASFAVIFAASILGLPTSTTHVISSAFVGVGATKDPACVNWRVAFRMVIVWFTTLPVCLALAYFLGLGLNWLA